MAHYENNPSNYHPPAHDTLAGAYDDSESDHDYSAERQKQEKTSKVLGKLLAIMSGITPVFTVGIEGSTIMSKKTLNQYREYEMLVAAARDKEDPTHITGYHSPPTKWEFAQWQQDGIVDSGITTPTIKSLLPPGVGIAKYQNVNVEGWGTVEGSVSKPSQYIDTNPKLLQDRAWASYADNIPFRPSETAAVLSGKEIGERFETDHAVKRTPRFLDQAEDHGRTNQLTYKRFKKIKKKGAHAEYKEETVTESEHDAIVGLRNKLQRISTESSDGDERLRAHGMLERISFIGEKEYKEATTAIAEYWKSQLDENDHLQIYAVAGEIAKTGYMNDAGEAMVKSDDYLLDNILANFSDEEMKQYAGRLIADEKDITATDHNDIKVVLLDDWTISGSQLKSASKRFIQYHPDLAKSVEIQLLAAPEHYLRDGFNTWMSNGSNDTQVPIRSYFLAHNSPYASISGAHITGAHSSVDFDFEHALSGMVMSIDGREPDIRSTPLTSIVRPYRQKGVKLTQKARLQKINDQVARKLRERQSV